MRPDGELRYLLGRALEPLRHGYAPLLRLSDSEAERVVRLATALLGPQAEFEPATQDFWQLLSPAAQKTIADVQAARSGPPKDAGQDPTPTHAPLPSVAALTVQECLSALPLCADRAGLLAADDLVVSISMMARAQGQDLYSGTADLAQSAKSQRSARSAESMRSPGQVGSPGPQGSPNFPLLVDATSDPAEPNNGILLGQVFGGAELARYYLSDSYDEITTALADTSRL